MDTGNDIKADLNISMQTYDIRAFSDILEKVTIHYTL